MCVRGYWREEFKQTRGEHGPNKRMSEGLDRSQSFLRIIMENPLSHLSRRAGRAKERRTSKKFKKWRSTVPRRSLSIS